MALQVKPDIPDDDTRSRITLKNRNSLLTTNPLLTRNAGAQFSHSLLFQSSLTKPLHDLAKALNSTASTDKDLHLRFPSQHQIASQLSATQASGSIRPIESFFSQNSLELSAHSTKSSIPDNARIDPITLGAAGNNSPAGISGGGGYPALPQNNPTSLNGLPMPPNMPSGNLHDGGAGAVESGSDGRVQAMTSTAPSQNGTAKAQAVQSVAAGPSVDSTQPLSYDSASNKTSNADAKLASIAADTFSLQQIPLHQTGGSFAPVISLAERMPTQGTSRIYVEGRLNHLEHVNSINGEPIANSRIEILLLPPDNSGGSTAIRSLGILQTKSQAVATNPTSTFAGLINGDLVSNANLYARVVGTNAFDYVSAPYFYTSSSDSDADGVPDRLESTTLHSDINQDNVPDGQQANALSLLDPRYGEWLSLSTHSGTFKNARTFLPTLSADQAKLPYGLIGFELENIPIGGMATVQLRLPSDTPANQYWKMDAATSSLVDFSFDGTTGAKLESGVFQLYLQDGGRGDADGIANGRIVDPGGPGTAPFNMFSIPESNFFRFYSLYQLDRPRNCKCTTV
ncbi:MAG: hypothetical protein NTY15_14775 [Planctomycetota bacterium]|nr:hypothetical protein [Planctomycetota bacterium]